jgi:hypothetical protein
VSAFANEKADFRTFLNAAKYDVMHTAQSEIILERFRQRTVCVCPYRLGFHLSAMFVETQVKVGARYGQFMFVGC